MCQNKLKLNDSKTEFMVIGKPSVLKDINKPSLTLNDAVINPTQQLRNLGIIFDENLTLSSHVVSVC